MWCQHERKGIKMTFKEPETLASSIPERTLGTHGGYSCSGLRSEKKHNQRNATTCELSKDGHPQHPIQQVRLLGENHLLERCVMPSLEKHNKA
jgi:hypothetical protein